MNGIMTDLTQSVSWKDLKQHFLQIKNRPIVELFSTDPQRAKKFSLTEKDIHFDYSKNPIVEKTLNLLAKLADNAHLKQHIDDLFSGACVNTTQQLPALHTALRDPRKSGLIVKGEDVLVKIHACLNKMHLFVEQIHKDQWRSFSEKKITDIMSFKYLD